MASMILPAFAILFKPSISGHYSHAQPLPRSVIHRSHTVSTSPDYHAPPPSFYPFRLAVGGSLGLSIYDVLSIKTMTSQRDRVELVCRPSSPFPSIRPVNITACAVPADPLADRHRPYHLPRLLASSLVPYPFQRRDHDRPIRIHLFPASARPQQPALR